MRQWFLNCNRKVKQPQKTDKLPSPKLPADAAQSTPPRRHKTIHGMRKKTCKTYNLKKNLSPQYLNNFHNSIPKRQIVQLIAAQESE